ncbi:MAG: branched-chain amino acid ABC transporter permease [Candidatus Nanopusillus acidilobi]|jgi:branched-chain amino acid transport system permease protein
MNISVLYAAIIYSSMLGLMSFGVTFVKITSNVWNVAHTSFITFAAYIVFTFESFYGNSPYLYLPLGFIIGAFLAIIEYLLIIDPLRKRGSSSLLMLVSTIAFLLIVDGIIDIYSDYLQNIYKFPSKNFILSYLDFNFLGFNGIFLFSFTFLIIILILLYLILTYTKFGIALRASVDDPILASVTGINIKYVNIFAWFIAGGTAGIAGALLPMWTQCFPGVGDTFLAIIFSVSIVGGVQQIYGTFLGSFLIGFIQIFGILGLSIIFGSSILVYQYLIPMIIMILVLLFLPEGLGKINFRKIIINIKKRRQKK